MKPLLLWMASHPTLAAEELPLFLEAGFRVVPLLRHTDTLELDESLAERFGNSWRTTVELPDDVVRALQRLPFRVRPAPVLPADAVRLLVKHVDATYVSVWPQIAAGLALLTPRTIMFRAFEGMTTNYSRHCAHAGVSLDALDRRPNFVWTPILSTFTWQEDDRLCRNPQRLCCFVTPSRLGPERWDADASEPYVVDTIPRIWHSLNRASFERHVADYGRWPMKILGLGNEPRGGSLGDERILGQLPQDAYYATARRARISVYHGVSPLHMHYHPIEFMTMGVPVLFASTSAIAAEAREVGFEDAALTDMGMWASADEANRTIAMAFESPQAAARIAQKQVELLDHVFSRSVALRQARWLRTIVTQRMKRPVGAPLRK